jgi:hypothetical protein
MIKKINVLIFFLLSVNIYAQTSNSTILKCLGAEEFQYHKSKYTGPLYTLNKNLISNLLQVDKSIRVREKYLTQVCKSSEPSLSFLKILLTKKRIFRVISKDNDLDDNVARGSVEIVLKNAPSIFLKFLSNLKASAPTPNCLEKQIPEIDKLFTEIRYLEKEYSLDKIIHSNNRIKTILSKLKKWKKIIAICKKDLLPKKKKVSK